MVAPPLADNEPIRLQALQDMHLLDSPVEDRFERITRMACRFLNVPISAVSLVDTDRQWFKSIQGLDVKQTPRSVSFCGHTILSDEMLVVADARQDQRFRENPLVQHDPNIVFYAGCPLKAKDGSRVGSLCVIDHDVHPWTAEDAQTLRDLAGLAETEIRAELQESLQTDLLQQIAQEQLRSSVDPLTRLWNREAIFEQISAALEKAKRDWQVITVMLGDLDHFKQLNDQHGHRAGDEALQETSKRMLSAIRSQDVVGRYGGEEFAFCLTRIDSPESAGAVAERVRTMIADQPVKTHVGPIDLTMSLGLVSVFPSSTLTVEQLLDRADQALYKAKSNGRNRVETDYVGLQESKERSRLAG
jgi:diguanylate cyclase (GGDEF)-like protein